jgi:hybrid cluster-associated redox disulfide protein
MGLLLITAAHVIKCEKTDRKTFPIMSPLLSPDITVKELLDRYPRLLQPFMDFGLLCVGCPTEAFHTLVDVAREYHLDLNHLLQRIDRVIRDDEES